MNYPTSFLDYISAFVLSQAVHQSMDGVVVVDASSPDLRVIYVNSGFERMTGYRVDEVVGRNCSFLQVLQDKSIHQRGQDELRQAIAAEKACRATLRNYRKDGSEFWNEISLSPAYNDAKVLTHFICVLRDVTQRVTMLERVCGSLIAVQKNSHQLTELASTDGLTGLANRRLLDEQSCMLLDLSIRAQIPIAVLMIDLDFFKAYNDCYGHLAGDDCLRQVATCIAAAFQRPGECVARYGGEEFSVIVTEMAQEELQQHVQRLCYRIYALSIPHMGSTYGMVTVSVGGVVLIPDVHTQLQQLFERADQALYYAKQHGRHQVHINTYSNAI